MSKIYKIKYLIWYEDWDQYIQHEYTYSNTILNLEEAIEIAKSLIDQYISCSDNTYTTFELNDHHFGAYREYRILEKADGIRVWVE